MQTTQTGPAVELSHPAPTKVANLPDVFPVTAGANGGGGDVPGPAFSHKATPSRSPAQGDEVREEVQRLARKARDAFRLACESAGAGDVEQGDEALAAAKKAIRSLWDYAVFRDRPFRDLLAAIDAAVRHRSIDEFVTAQRDVLGSAFGDLAKWLLGDEEVGKHLDRFAEHNIDILAPVTPRPAVERERFEVIIRKLSD